MPTRFLLLFILGLNLELGWGGDKIVQFQTTDVSEENARADIPEVLRKEMEQFGHQFEADLRGNDPAKILASFNPQATAERVCEGIELAADRLQSFREGLTEGAMANFVQQSQVWPQADGKFKGVMLAGNQPVTRFRFTSSGVTMMDLVLQKDAVGKLRIVDFYNHATGGGLVELLHQTSMPNLAALDPLAISPVFKAQALTLAQMEEVTDYFGKAQKLDWAGVIAAYPHLPPAIRDQRMATISHVMAQLRSGDREGYRKALQEGAAKFKSANFQFMMIDLCFLEQRYADGVRALETIMRTVGQDAALLAMKANMENVNGDLTGAQKTLREGLLLEPDCLYANLMGVTILSAAKDYASLRDSLRVLEKSGRYNIREILKKEPQLVDFRDSLEAADWR